MSNAPLVSDEEIATGGNLYNPRALTPYQVKAIYEAELQSLRARISRMEEASTNILNRWDSPSWEWDKHGHTAGLMADLRNALSNK